MRPRLLASVIVAVGLLVGSVQAAAAPIIGSLPLAGFSVSENGTNLAVSTSINAILTGTSGPGIGDYTGIPLLTVFGPLTANLSNAATGFGVTLSNAIYGSFSASAGSIVTQTANFLDLFIEGTFTPGPGMPAGLSPTPTSLRISINQSGSSLSMGITLVSPNDPRQSAPEPASLALVGLGLAGLAAARRRKLN